MPHTQHWITRPVLVAACAALALSALPSAEAEVVRFRNGVVLHGEVVESEQTWFKFRRYDTGGVVTLSWDQILEQDRTKLRSELRLDLDEANEGPTIPGVRLYLKSGESVDGLIDSDKTTESEYWIRTTAGSFPYKRSMVERSEELQLDILSVMSRPDALQHELDRRSESGVSNTSAKACFEISEYCMSIAHYTAAKDYLDQCRQTDPGYEPQAVENVLTQLGELIAQAEAMQMYSDVERLMANKKFADSRAQWKALTEQFPEAKVVADNEDSIETKIDAAEAKYLETQVKPRFFTALRLAINQRARTKVDTIEGQKEEFTLKAAKNWARKECAKLAADDVAAQLQITADQVREVFANRKSYDFRHASYGDGTFIVEKATLKLPNNNNAAAQIQARLRGRGGNQGGAPPPPKPQELQTPDDWWAKASASKRTQWISAYYAEYGGDMEILRIDSGPCVSCGGKGYKTSLAPGVGGGGTQYRLCERCHGVGHDRKVVYR